MRTLLFLVLSAACCAAQSFNIVLLPDTQYETGGGTAASYIQAAAQWACSNAQAVIGLGDITNDAGSTSFANSWTDLYGVLDACGVHYLPIPGNHDYTGTITDRNLSLFNAKYGVGTQYTNHPWYGGGFPAGTNNDSYITATLGGQKFLFLGLQFYAPAAEVQWAQSIIAANPDKLVIVSTHGHLYPDANGNATYETGPCNTGNGQPSCYNFNGTNSTDAVTLFNTLKQYPNVIAIVSGHDWLDHYPLGSVWRQDAATDGHTITQMIVDYQEYSSGNGYVRVLTFTPSTSSSGTVVASSYSPYCAAVGCALPATLGNGNALGNFQDVESFTFSYSAALQNVATPNTQLVNGAALVSGASIL